jgi:hypothetical protein
MVYATLIRTRPGRNMHSLRWFSQGNRLYRRPRSNQEDTLSAVDQSSISRVHTVAREPGGATGWDVGAHITSCM